jgi:isopentenyl phosphate kinase
MFIIKLGGSVITDKTKEKTYKQNIIDNLSHQIKLSEKESIIVHGAGSFGHIPAKNYNLNNGYKNNTQIYGFSLTHNMVQELNSYVITSLLKKGIPAVSIPPHSIIKLNNNKKSKFDFYIFEDYLKLGIIPVTFGDVVLDEKLGFSICSGDLLVEELTNHFRPEKVIFVIDEDGLYTSNPKLDKNSKLIEKTTIDEINNFSTSLDSHPDVTGGMEGKIDTIKKIVNLGIDTVLLNGNKPERLYKTLIGETTISTIVCEVKK